MVILKRALKPKHGSPTAALLAQADDNEQAMERAYTMRELVEQAADYLKAGDVDRAGCTLSEALK